MSTSEEIKHITIRRKRDMDDGFTRQQQNGEKQETCTKKSKHDETHKKEMLKMNRLFEIVADWLNEIAHSLQYLPETRETSILLFRKYTKLKTPPKEKHQLIAAVALSLSAKFHEIEARKIEDYMHISAFTFTYDQMEKMEYEVFLALKGRMWIDTPTQHIYATMYTVDERYNTSLLDPFTKEDAEIAKAAITYSLHNIVTSDTDPKLLAYAAMHFTGLVTKKEILTVKHIENSSYTLTEILRTSRQVNIVVSHIYNHETLTACKEYSHCNARLDGAYIFDDKLFTNKCMYPIW